MMINVSSLLELPKRPASIVKPLGPSASINSAPK